MNNEDLKIVGFKRVGLGPQKEIYIIKESEDSLIRFTTDQRKATPMKRLERKRHIKNLYFNDVSVNVSTIREI